VQNALQSLPWVRKVHVDYAKAVARVTVETKSCQVEKLIAAVKVAGFGAELIAREPAGKPAETPAETPSGNVANKSDPMVTFHVIGMKKTKSGAT